MRIIHNKVVTLTYENIHLRWCICKNYCNVNCVCCLHKWPCA